MYQREVMTSACKTEHRRDEEADDLVRDQEEYCRNSNHDEHHGRGDRGFPLRRPGHLGGFGPPLLQEFERTELRHNLRLTHFPLIPGGLPAARVEPQFRPSTTFALAYKALCIWQEWRD